LSGSPLISCLMVTRPTADRLPRFKRSVADYLRQTHVRRELVVVVDGRVDDPTTEVIREHLAGLGRDDIRLVEPVAESLGALRNVSLAESRGEIRCQWDDDDRHHPDRLARQWRALVDEDAESILLQHLWQFIEPERRLYCVNWFGTQTMGHPATLMCLASAPIAYPESGPESHLGEDIVVVDQLQGRGRYRLLANEPNLYVYVTHGANAYSVAHHMNLVEWLSLSSGLLRRKEAAFREGLAPFDFGPAPVVVQGSNGPAFTIG